MRRATVTLPDDVAEAVEDYRKAQEATPALTTVIQVALREFLRKRGYFSERRTSEK